MVTIRSRLLVIVLLASFVVPFTGCGNKDLAAKIGDFQSAVNNTTAAITICYSELNQVERDLYLEERLRNKNLTIDYTEDDGHGGARLTPFAGKVFSAESIKARTDAIQALASYGKNLAALAGSKAPEQFATGSEAIGKNLTSLAGTFSTLTHDNTARNYAAPLSALGTIFGEIGRLVLEAKRDAALKKAVNEGAPNVRKILDLLEADMNTVIGPLQITAKLQGLAEKVSDYNNNKNNLSNQERAKLIEEIKKAQQMYELALTFNPTDLLSSLRDANEALIKFVNSKHNPKTILELDSMLEAFKERAVTIATAVAQLRALRRGQNG